MIGYHMQGPANGWLDAVGVLPAGTPIKAVDRADLLRDAKNVNSGVVTILRHWYDHGQTFDGSPYAVLLDRARTFFASFVDGTFASQYAAYVDVIETWNETLAESQTPEEKQMRIDQCRAFCEVWAADYAGQYPDIRLCLANAAVGNSIPLGMAALAESYGHYLGYHPYLWMSGGQVQDNDWLAYRHEIMDAEYLANGVTVRWLGTEAGPYFDAGTGWRDVRTCDSNDVRYADVMRQFASRMADWNGAYNHRFRGAVLFTTRGGDVWAKFETVQPEMNRLAGVAQEFPLDDDTPPPPPPPPPPDCGDLSFEGGWTTLTDRMQQPEGMTLRWFKPGEKLPLGIEEFSHNCTGTIEAKHLKCGEQLPVNQCVDGDDPLILCGEYTYKMQAVTMASGTTLEYLIDGPAGGRAQVEIPVNVHYHAPDTYDRSPPLEEDDVIAALIINDVLVHRLNFPELRDRQWLTLRGEGDYPLKVWLYFQTSYANTRDLFTDQWVIKDLSAPPPADWQREAWDESVARQTIQLNPDAALQAAIFADDFVPVQSEFWYTTADGVQRAYQAAESLKTGERRVYYAVVPDWTNIGKFGNPGDDPAIQDIADELPKHASKTYTTRPLEDVNTLTIHHTVGWSGDDMTAITNIANYHVDSRDWPGIGYHYVISPGGTIYKTNYHTTWSFHVGLPGNGYAVGIALGGDFTNGEPPQVQQDAARALVAYLRGVLPIVEVLPHRFMPNAATQCPGNTFEAWFDYVAGA